MIAVKNPKELACCRCKHQKKHRCSNGWTCLLTQEKGYPAYLDALDRLDNCPLVTTDCTLDQIAIGTNFQFDKLVAEKHSHIEESKQSSCAVGTACHASGLYICHKCGAKVKTACYFDEDNGLPICIKCKNKKEMEGSITISTNHQFTHVVIDGREYCSDEIVEILKKHKEEEDKKCIHCERCGEKYLDNTEFDMVDYDLDERSDACSAPGHPYTEVGIGYLTKPFIRGFRVLSTCGKGREVKLCDRCIGDLLQWLNRKEE